MSFLDRRREQNAGYYAQYDSRTIDPKWDSVDTYLTRKLIPEATEDGALAAAFTSHAENDLPLISVNPSNGKLLYLMALSSGSKSILEIGTLAAYSTIWMAKAIQARSGAKIVTLEFEEKHAQIARQNIDRAGFFNFVEIIQGDAQNSLRELVNRKEHFDFIFSACHVRLHTGYFRSRNG